MQIRKQTPTYDVVVIGSGASGGMAAWNLTRQGINVLLLDAGDRFDPDKFWMALLPYERRERLARGERPPQFFVSSKEQPLLTPPGNVYTFYRVWGHGGKTNVWGRVSLRYADLDFKVNDGYGIPWPFEYKDIKPYYDQVDQLIGVCGGTDDSDSLPGSQYHQPAPAPRCGEWALKNAGRRIGIEIVSGRRANLTRPHRGRAACHYCGDCGSGCTTGSFFNTAMHLLPEALGTGKLKIISNAVVARITVDSKTGLANGVQYFHRHTKRESQVRAKVVVLGALAVDSTRILPNSKSSTYPSGIGNNLSYTDNEHRMSEEMADTVESLVRKARGELLSFKRGEWDLPGSAIHEHGTCRMGSDPKTSALNGFNQMHAVKNLFVVDGSSFPSATEKNPTLTILAVAWRASDYLAEQLRRGNL
jgi:choline dehydrogenase-like flavoprotein